MLRIVGILVVGLLAAISTAATVLLVRLGNHAHWSSDGPGMLFVMMAIGVLGVAAWGLWRLFFALLRGSSGDGARADELPRFEIRQR